MLSVMQASYFSDMLDTAWASVPELESNDKSLADTLVNPLEEEEIPFYYQPQARTSDDEIEAYQIMLDMICLGVPESTIRHILKSSYDIIPPVDSSCAPYIVISYADDTEESVTIARNNACPLQAAQFLQVPPPGMTARDRSEPEYECEIELKERTVSDIWEDFEYDATLEDPELRAFLLAPGWLDIAFESGGFSWGCGGKVLAEGLSALRSAMIESNPVIEQVKTVKITYLNSRDTEVEDWSNDFDLAEEGVVEIGQDQEVGEHVDMDDENAQQDTGRVIEIDLLELDVANSGYEDEMEIRA